MPAASADHGDRQPTLGISTAEQCALQPAYGQPVEQVQSYKILGPGFEPCLGQSAKLAGAPKPLCLNQIDEICRVSVKRRAPALRLISLAGSRSGLVGLLTVTHPLPSDTPGGGVGLCRGQRPPFRGRCAGVGVTSPTTWQGIYSTIKSGIASTDERGGLPRNRSG